MFNKLLKSIMQSWTQDNESSMRDELLKLEAIVGGDVFGEVTGDRYREFYCQNERTWIWHEQWSEDGESKEMITTYDVRDEGVFKSFNGSESIEVSPKEILRLYEAAKRYRVKIKQEVYQYI